MFLCGYKNLSVTRVGVRNDPGPQWGARFDLDQDLRPLFPYVNGQFNGAKLRDQPERIQFVLDGVGCTLYSTEVVAAPFDDQKQAQRFVDRMVATLNELYERRASLRPSYRKTKDLSVLALYRLLPKTNCRECGKPSCLAFAGALSRGATSPDRCRGISNPLSHHAVYPVYDRDGNLASTLEIELPLPPDKQGETAPLAAGGVTGISLTPREIEVLRLLARGATNPQISAALAVSRHTVKSHVTHILGKLGVQDRTAAAVWASRRNLA